MFPSPIDYAGETAARFGVGVHVKYHGTGLLNNKGFLKSAGSIPSATGNANYDDLNLRRSGDGSYYVQGHLLSSHLNGTGKDWKNLTPLSRSGNALHEAQVEQHLKAAAKAAAQGPGRAFLYSVVPQYGRPLRRDLLAQLATSADPHPAAKRRVIEAEQHVPLTLVCRIQEVSLTPARPGDPPLLELSEVVPNRIEQNSLDDYQIGTLEPPVYINLLRSVQAAKKEGFSDAGAVSISNFLTSRNFFVHKNHLLKPLSQKSDRDLINSLPLSFARS